MAVTRAPLGNLVADGNFCVLMVEFVAQMSTLMPLDFNSLSVLKQGVLQLSDYYIDYALVSVGITPEEGMAVIFYDKNWTSDPLWRKIL
jgi:hypothetical protein